MRIRLCCAGIFLLVLTTAAAQVSVHVTSTLRVTDTVQLTALVSGSTNQKVVWKVNGITGGNSTVGTVSTTGLYVAPATIPTPGTVKVTAVSEADRAKSSSTMLTIVSCAPVPEGIISWWPGESGPQDFSGNNRGSLKGGITFVPGEVGLGFDLDGTSGYVNVGDSSSLRAITQTISVEMWVKPRKLASDSPVAYMYSRRDPLISESFNVYMLADGTLGVVLRTTSSPNSFGSKFESSPGVVKVGELQHIAATANSNTSVVQAYLNGINVPLFNVSGPPSFSGNFFTVHHLYLGRRQEVKVEGRGGAAYFPGVMDEISLYSVELSQNQITNIFSAGLNGKCR
jgi:hypothetical protein